MYLEKISVLCILTPYITSLFCIPNCAFKQQTFLTMQRILIFFFSEVSKEFQTIKVYCSVQSLSCIQLFATPWTAASQASLSITNSWNLLELMSIESVMPSKHLILCCPSPSPPTFNLSQHQGLFQWVSIRWLEYCSFSISPSNECSGLISFRIDWLDLLAVQGTLKSLLQHHSSKASILWLLVFFTVQLLHP